MKFLDLAPSVHFRGSRSNSNHIKHHINQNTDSEFRSKCAQDFLDCQAPCNALMVVNWLLRGPGFCLSLLQRSSCAVWDILVDHFQLCETVPAAHLISRKDRKAPFKMASGSASSMPKVSFVGPYVSWQSTYLAVSLSMYISLLKFITWLSLVYADAGCAGMFCTATIALRFVNKNHRCKRPLAAFILYVTVV